MEQELGGSGEARGRRVRRSAHSCVLVFDGVRPTQAERNGWVGRKAVTLDGGFSRLKKKIRFFNQKTPSPPASALLVSPPLLKVSCPREAQPGSSELENSSLIANRENENSLGNLPLCANCPGNSLWRRDGFLPSRLPDSNPKSLAYRRRVGAQVGERLRPWERASLPPHRGGRERNAWTALSPRKQAERTSHEEGP